MNEIKYNKMQKIIRFACICTEWSGEGVKHL